MGEAGLEAQCLDVLVSSSPSVWMDEGHAGQLALCYKLHFVVHDHVRSVAFDPPLRQACLRERVAFTALDGVHVQAGNAHPLWTVPAQTSREQPIDGATSRDTPQSCQNLAPSRLGGKEAGKRSHGSFLRNCLGSLVTKWLCKGSSHYLQRCCGATYPEQQLRNAS